MLVRSGKDGRDKVIKMLYQNEQMRAKAIKYVTTNSGTKEDGLSVYCDSILTLVKQMATRRNWSITSSLDSYLAGIVRYTWLNDLRKRKKASGIDEATAVEDNSALVTLITTDRHEYLHKTLDYLGDRCKEVLLLWANGYSMQEIADQCCYKSTDMAKKKKYQCLKGLIAFIERSPQVKERLR